MCRTILPLWTVASVSVSQYLTKKLGADATIYGQIQTVFAVAQLLGGVLYGRLGDLFSDRTALLVAFSSAAASYLVTGFARSLPMLFLSRMFCVLMHVMQGKLSYIVLIILDYIQYVGP